MAETGCVYLVGAGCGAADLITLRGLRLLQTCEAVVYDDLIDPALLAQVPLSAERYCAGKRAGRHSMPQPEINELLVRLGRSGKQVVRLKGGDPFVFGRGGEEFLALREAGIRCQVVPGISSSIAVPGAAGIPVTHRRAARSFHVITGHTADGTDGLPEDLDTLARLNGTLVFLMGLGALETIAARLMAAGKPADTPAAVVSGGNAPHPATVRGTLADIAARTRAAGVQAPAVILVGQTAALELADPPAGPLAGQRVGLVGTDTFVDRLGEKLTAAGAEPRLCVAARTEALPVSLDWESLTDGTPRWLVLTSVNGVERLFALLRENRVDLRKLAGCRFAAIGPATAAALTARGIQPDLCPATATGEELGRLLIASVPAGQPILLLRAQNSTPLLHTMLREAGYPVEEHSLYRTVYQPLRPAQEGETLVFGSAAGVRAYAEAFGAPGAGVKCVCIGPVTAAELARHTAAPFATAPDISADGILACLETL